MENISLPEAMEHLYADMESMHKDGIEIEGQDKNVLKFEFAFIGFACDNLGHHELLSLGTFCKNFIMFLSMSFFIIVFFRTKF